MVKFKVNEKCVGCGACVEACPTNSIKIDKDNKAVIDQETCEQCGKCQEICPFGAIDKTDD